MFLRNVILVILVAILTSCEKELFSSSKETGNVVMNIITSEKDIDVDAFSQYTIEIFPKYSGNILSEKIENLKSPFPLDCGYYHIEITSPIKFVENNVEYRYFGCSDLFKVEPDETITVPIELKLSAFHVVTEKIQ